MRSLLRYSPWILPYLALAPIASAAILADSTADFSDTQGARGWFYGYFPNGNANAFTKLPAYDSQTQSWQQATCCPPATRVAAYSFMHPNGTNNGQEQWAAREWVSTYSGSVVVAGRLSKVQRSGKSSGVYGRIFLNHQQVANSYINGGDENGIIYSAKFTVPQGDIFDFVAAPNGADTFKFGLPPRFGRSVARISRRRLCRFPGRQGDPQPLRDAFEQWLSMPGR